MSKMQGLLPALAGTLLSFGAVSAQTVLPRVTPEEAELASAPLQEITALLEDVVAQGRIAGAVVGVARNGKVGYLEAVGVQDVDGGAPMTDGSIFRIYSMTKAVTAVAAMILHEQGRFTLSDPVSAYLPEFANVTVLQDDGSTRPPARPVTVEHLLLHTAGLSHRSSSEYQAAGVRARDITLEQFITNITSVPLRADPGDEYRYSASPTVLGRLVEIWSGQPFDVFVHERILEPLGMHDTGFWVEPEDVGRLATMYASEDGGLRPYQIEAVPFTERPALMEGAVGLVSTVPDFMRFAQMLLDGGALGGTRILSEASVERLTRNGLPDALLARRRGGTGWGLASVSVVVNASSAGDGARTGEFRWDGSAGTEFWVDPTTRTVLVTMWQSAPANPDRLRQRITSLVRNATESTQ
jgi:CubicO group peptidase (beta-lactamase class C family)